MNKKEQKEKFIELANLIKECSQTFSEALVASDHKQLVDKIFKLEARGDEIQIELDSHYAQEKNIPYLALDRARLLRRIDDTLDEFVLASRNLNIFSSSLPKDFSTKTAGISENVAILGSYLSKAIEVIFADFQDCLVLVEKIEDLRDKIFDAVFTIEGEYFKTIDTSSGWKPFFSLTEILKRTVACVVAMKNTSEVLTLMVYKYD
ncbi:MAG: DUF47 family protein [Candidatus Heimdallarchaeota archaeon]|nr:DUF47 family protein [Candidatus Heimdallarchaeota archaeon]